MIYVRLNSEEDGSKYQSLWNIDTQVQSGLVHPSYLLTKFGVPDVWFEEAAFGDIKDQ
jgi:hypothetical protein